MEETHLKGDSSAADTEELNIKNGVDKTSSNENGKEHIRSSQDYIKGNDSFTLKVLKTMALYLAYVGMGMTAGGYGPSVVNLEILLDTDLKTLGLAMTFGSVGYLIGSVIGGALVDRINQEFLFGSGALCLGLSITLYPWAPNIFVFAALQIMCNAAAGSEDAGGQAYLLSLWHGAKYKEPLFQALHALWSIGAALGPFMIRPFLVPLPDQSPGCATVLPVYTNMTLNESTRVEMINDCNVTSTEGPPDVERVRYGFAIIGVVNLLGALAFYGIFLIEGPFCLLKKEKHLTQETGGKRKEDMRYKGTFLFMMYWFYFLYAWCECIPGSFLAVLAVKGLGWDVSSASILAAVYWGGTCLGRLLAIPISGKCTARQMLIATIVLSATSFLLLSIFAETYDVIVWGASGMAGLSLSCIFASCILWASDYIWISGLSAGVLLVGSSSGALIAFPPVGYLSQTYSYMWIAYIPLIAAALNISLFAGMQAFASFYPHKREINDKETEVELQPIKSDQEHTEQI